MITRCCGSVVLVCPGVPVRGGAGLGVAGAIAGGSGQRGTQVVREHLVIDGTEHQAGLEAWNRKVHQKTHQEHKTAKR